MSKLEQLIAELCPDGVEYVELEKISNYSLLKIDAKQVNSSNYVGVDNLLPDKKGKVNSSYVPKEGRLIKFLKGDVLIGNIRPYLKKIWLATDEGGTNGDVLVIQINDRKIISSEYLFYVLSSNQFFNYNVQNSKGAKMPRGDKTALMKYRFPLPPLPIQHEIVRILDTFTELTAQLTAELKAELTARKKQYEYYRDTLFNFDNTVNFLLLGEIADIGTGSSNTNEDMEEGRYPFFVRSQEVRRKDTYEYDETAVITSGDGVGVGKIFHYIEGKYALHQRAYRIHIKHESIIPKYYFYYMRCAFMKYIQRSAVNSSVTSIRKRMLDEFPVPLPPLAEQERIVAILDRFDTLCNDLTSGLPAEIEARRKQYEYYRDKLLTFKEKQS